jgi:hypothetical protein
MYDKNLQMQTMWTRMGWQEKNKTYDLRKMQVGILEYTEVKRR